MSLFIVLMSSLVHAESVLYLGDSQSFGNLGYHMYSELSSDETNVHLFGVVSSSPRHWLARNQGNPWLCRRTGRYNRNRSYSMASLCRQLNLGEKVYNGMIRVFQPDRVFFQFLGNSVGQSKERLQKRVAELLGPLAEDTECVFITSLPHYISRSESNRKRLITQEYIGEIADGRCHFIRGVTDETMEGFAKVRENYARDRMHLSSAGARRFFNYIMQNMP